MNKKIIITTLISNHNFGNRLQATALNEIIKELGYDPVFFRYELTSENTTIIENLKYILGFLNIKCRFYYLKRLRKKTLKKYGDIGIEYTPFASKNYDTKDLDIEDNYVAGITGSDQVWHKWTDYENELPFYYLQFLPENNRISFGASFGFDSFAENDLEQHIEGISGIRHLSCREQSAGEIIRELVNREATIVLDPTLCIRPSFWEEYEERPEWINNDKYILVFYLGKFEYLDSEIGEFAEKNELKIINLNDMHNKRVWETTPQNFVWLVHNAEYVLTDSFHCVAFSVIFHKRFLAFKRNSDGFTNMFDRIDTLLRLTGLTECEYGNIIKFAKMNCTYTDEKLRKASEESKLWLRNSIEKTMAEYMR